jgi:hypothetical protein
MNQAIDWLNPQLAMAMKRADGNDEDRKTREEDTRAWPTEDDVHFQAIAGDVRQAPGANGTRDVSAVVRNVLDRVRRNIRERANGATD